jgi:hypothetical protein
MFIFICFIYLLIYLFFFFFFSPASIKQRSFTISCDFMYNIYLRSLAMLQQNTFNNLETVNIFKTWIWKKKLILHWLTDSMMAQ